MLGRLIVGEIKKILRPKSLITLCVFFAVFFVLFAVFYNINWDGVLSDLSEQTGGEMDIYIEMLESEPEFLTGLDATNVDERIAIYQAEYDRVLESGKGGDYYYKSVVTVLNYVKDNNLYDQDLKIAGEVSIVANAENFAMVYFGTVLTILSIYAIVMMSGMYADEYRNGTIKLVMLRPVSPSQVTLAKILAMFAVLLGLLGITTLIGFLYGLAAFGSVGMTNVLVVFNARHIWKMTYSGYIFLSMLLSTVSLLSYSMLAFVIGTLLKRKTMAILISFVVFMGIVSSLLSFLNIGRWLFSHSISLANFLSINGGAPHKANFFIAMPMNIVYNALMYFGVFFVTNKRDIA